MKRISQAAIRRLIEDGTAIDLTTAAPSVDLRRNLEPVAVSRGSCGMNGAVFISRVDGALFAIGKRNSNLFFYL